MQRSFRRIVRRADSAVVGIAGKVGLARQHVVGRPGHRDERDRLARSARSHSSISLSNGLALSCRTVSRSAALMPLMSRSMANSASMRFTASRAIGEIGLAPLPRRALRATSASSKNFRRMGEAEGGRCRHLLPLPVEQRIEAIVAICLKDTAELGQMPLRVFSAPVAGGVADRHWRCRPGEWLIVAHVNPYSPGRALALGQDRDRRVIAVKPLRLEHMRPRSGRRPA